MALTACEPRMPPSGLHTNDVDDDHAAVAQLMADTKTDAVVSVEAKLRPLTVILTPKQTTLFDGAENETTGAAIKIERAQSIPHGRLDMMVLPSNVNAELRVPDTPLTVALTRSDAP